MVEIGDVLAVGKVAGKVVRHFTEGFTVQFKYPQGTSDIERPVIHRCRMSRTDYATLACAGAHTSGSVSQTTRLRPLRLAA